MISVAEALQRCLDLTRPLDVEEVALRHAAGRVLARPVVALRDQPPFAASAMDGYAIRKADLCLGARLRVVGEAPAGRAWAGQLGQGEALRIFTGAPLPQGADHIVIQEDVTAAEDHIVIHTVEDAAHIRPAGADFKTGAEITPPRRLSPADIALAAAMNAPRLSVYRRPEVAIIATGDELVSPGEDPRADQIIASNTYGLAAMAEAEGAIARLLPIARDTRASLAATFEMARGADLIVTVGGASVGDHDLVGTVAADMGLERSFYKIAMRPGKPLMAGRIGDAVLLGLPGNPVSAMVCGHLFMVPQLRAFQGLPSGARRTRTAHLTCDLPENGPRAHYMRASLTQDPDHPYPLITPFTRQDSALLTVFAEAGALLIRPPHDGPRTAGEPVDYLSL
ncbi:molybdopterin molybdotransferase MoeA [Rhodobacteraceae bacterium XHP0102]|nr:molybdopterin molybdotransferase MoeA [Rhodobacteraceae bacterium XHP0102]